MYYLAYLTANDCKQYQADFLNFLCMTTARPGVDRVVLYIAVSRVVPFDDVDLRAINRLVAMAADCPWFDVQMVLWKGNVGRDFSSAGACLREIECGARPEDYILVRNRSSYGPFGENWYAQFISQYKRFNDTGLVGSTINFLGHPARPMSGPTTHVQTYAYLSEWRHFALLADDYPASRCTDRLDLIRDGEIGLSRAMMERGLSLSCLYWPSERFTLARPDSPALPHEDIKKSTSNLVLRYKFPAYFYRPFNWSAQFKWWWQRTQSGSSQPQVRHLTLTEFD